MSDKPKSAILEELYKVIEKRRGANPEVSRTARLFKQGTRKIAKKVGEEAVEVAVAALTETRTDLVHESADLLYHLLVLWADRGIKPSQVFAELENRFGVSGIAEKKSRREKMKRHS